MIISFRKHTIPFVIVCCAHVITAVLLLIVSMGIQCDQENIITSSTGSLTDLTIQTGFWRHIYQQSVHLIQSLFPSPNPNSFFQEMDVTLMINDLNRNYTDQEGRPLRSLRDMVHKVQKNKVVLVTFTDASYLGAFYTSYQMSHLADYSNFLVVAMDEVAYHILDNQGYPVCYFPSDTLSQDQAKTESQFGSSVWLEKMAVKIKIIREVILLNYNILLFDSDVILLKDPIPPIHQYHSYDIIAQKDYLVCAGFMYVNSTLNSLKFLNRVLQTMKIQHKSDQPSITYLLVHNVQPSIRVKLLPASTYSSGNVFFATHQFQWDPIQETQIMIHNNYVVGYAFKMYRLKEMGLYPFDVDGEYSSETETFLMLDELMDNEKPILQLAVNLANHLNRSLVLPMFRCMPSIQLPVCNACGNEEYHCHKDILKTAKRPWKEHVFFDHPKVPAWIRKHVNEVEIVQFVHSNSECVRINHQGKKIHCIILRLQDNPFENILLHLEAYSPSVVIRIHSIVLERNHSNSVPYR